jgi:hypothetical protein
MRLPAVRRSAVIYWWQGALMFLAGLLIGVRLSKLYPRNDDKLLKEYLRKQYGGEKPAYHHVRR